MDTSEDYIKMCREAKEIQAVWTQSPGDYSWIGQENEIWISGRDEVWDYSPKGSTWLPRQDQLQEMLGEYQETIYSFLEEMMDESKGDDRDGNITWDSSPDYEFIDKYTSWEQLWLAFVMREKFNKTWTGERWE